eukprot:jgi/Psemu1/39608/gm1.39608_g
MSITTGISHCMKSHHRAPLKTLLAVSLSAKTGPTTSQDTRSRVPHPTTRSCNTGNASHLRISPTTSCNNTTMSASRCHVVPLVPAVLSPTSSTPLLLKEEALKHVLLLKTAIVSLLVKITITAMKSRTVHGHSTRPPSGRVSFAPTDPEVQVSTAAVERRGLGRVPTEGPAWMAAAHQLLLSQELSIDTQFAGVARAGTPSDFMILPWSQPNHSLTIALEAPSTWESLPYTKINNKTCKFWIDRPSPLGETSWNNSNTNGVTTRIDVVEEAPPPAAAPRTATTTSNATV